MQSHRAVRIIVQIHDKVELEPWRDGLRRVVLPPAYESYPWMPIVPTAPPSPDEMIHLDQARSSEVILKTSVVCVYARHGLVDILGQDMLNRKLGVCAMVI